VAYRDWLRDGATIHTDPATGEVDFHDPLGGASARTQRSISPARFACGAVSLGLAAVARAGVAIALTHAHRRESTDRFGTRRPVIDYRNQQRLLFSALASAVAATAVARRATELCWRIPPEGQRPGDPTDRSRSVGHGDDGVAAQPEAQVPESQGQPNSAAQAAAMRTASLTKVIADRLAERATARCRAACGGLGFLSVNRLVDYQGLALAFNAACGDNQMILLNAAWGMVTGGDYEPAPWCPPGQRDSPTQADVPGAPGEQENGSALLSAREHVLHRELTQYLTAAAGSGVEEFTAWNQRIDLAQRLAEAYMARMTMQAMVEWAATADTPQQAEVAQQLCRILLLEELAADAGWYLAEGLLTADQVRGLPDQLADADARLLPHASTVAEMLQVPTGIVRAAILSDDYIGTLAGRARLETTTEHVSPRAGAGCCGDKASRSAAREVTPSLGKARYR
jgi:acyl-CoA oxidase